MLRQEPSSFTRMLTVFNCNNSKKNSISDDEELLVNPFQKDPFEIIEKAHDIEAGPSISYCEDYTECAKLMSDCSTVVCCCGGVCCIGGCMFAGMGAGCGILFMVENAVIATFTPALQAITAISLSFGGMFSGYGVGALIWGQSVEAAQRWEGGRIEQGKSTSICGFFASPCESNAIEIVIDRIPDSPRPQ